MELIRFNSSKFFTESAVERTIPMRLAVTGISGISVVQQTKWWLVDFSVSNVKLSCFLVCRLLPS